MSNKKVSRYYKKFRDAEEAVDSYLNEVGGALAESQYISEPSDFLEALEKRIDDREVARVQLERVVREEQTGIGPITVQNRTVVSYDGAYLYDLFKDNPEVRDQLVEVQYKVKSSAFTKLAHEGTINAKQAGKAVTGRKNTVALRGVPTKIGLL